MRYGHSLILILTLVEFRVDAQPPTPDEPILGAPSAFDLSAGDDEPLVPVEAGTPLYHEPRASSGVLTRIEVAAELPALARHGSWTQVRHGVWRGWIHHAGELDEEFDLSWVPRSGPDPTDLERARRYLETERASTLGPFKLLTDIADDELIAELDRLAAQLPALMSARYGIEVVPDNADTVVIYAHEESYRSYARDFGGIVELGTRGHAVGGLAVVMAGEVAREEVRSTTVHEIVHLLTYRNFGEVPNWLAEGLAEDFGFSRVDARGELLPGTLDNWETTSSVPVLDRRGQIHFAVSVTHRGPRVSLEILRAAWRNPDHLALAQLFELTDLEFMDDTRRELMYPLSAFLARYLVSGEESDGFRAFLQAIREGETADSIALLTHLRTEVGDLQERYRRWLFSNDPILPRKNRGNTG